MSRNYRAALLAAACATALAGPAGAETLAEAVALAYQTNPTLRAQRSQLRALDETVVQAQTGYAPQASAGVTASIENGFDRTRRGNILNPGRGSTDALGAQLNVAQPLYTGGRVAASISGARADVLSGREQLRSVETNVLLSVIQAYADIRRDEEALRIRTENVSVLRRQLEEAGARFEVGEITRTDVALSEQRLALSESNLALAQATLANSRARYASVVGQNPGELAPEPPLPALPATVDEAYAIAEAESPRIRSADFAQLGARARTRAARAEFSPSLRLQGSAQASQSPIGLDVLGSGRDTINDQFTLQLGGTIPIFTGGLNASRVRQSLERENTTRFQIDEARRTVLNDVARFWNGLVAARASVRANEEQVRAARVAFEGVRAEVEVGLRTTLDVLNAQQELRDAELLRATARRDAYVAEASVLAAMGRLEAANLIGGVPIYDPTYTVQRRGLREGAVPYESLVERLDRVGVPSLERPNRTVPPTVEAPVDDTAEWRPQSEPQVIPRTPPPPVTPQPSSPPSVAEVAPTARPATPLSASPAPRPRRR